MVGIVLPSESAAGAALSKAIEREIDHRSLIEVRVLPLHSRGLRRTDLGAVHSQTLASAPHLSDPIASGAQAILAALVPPIYFTRIDLLGALSSLSVRCAYMNGIDDAGAMMLTLHAVMVSGEYKDFNRSYALGQVAIGYFKRYGGTSLACPTFKVYASHVAVWSEPIRDTLPSFREAVAFGIEYRDGEYLGFGSGQSPSGRLSPLLALTVCCTGELCCALSIPAKTKLEITDTSSLQRTVSWQWVVGLYFRRAVTDLPHVAGRIPQRGREQPRALLGPRSQVQERAQ